MPTTFEIHPTIGIARVGDSLDAAGFFLSPEPGQPLPASFRDSPGALKRQAARFHIFRCERDANNRLTSAQELTMADAQINWKVELANRKGCSKRLAGPGRRNGATSDDEPGLVIKPTSKSLNAVNSSANFDDGKFKTVTVKLGEMRTDAQGRLLVLGGRGISDSSPANFALQHFADNNNWFDDASDGPVKATVTIGGVTHEAKTAWVVVAPPDYAPEIASIVSWYDVALQAAVDRGFRTVASTPSYQEDILPILNRFIQLQWTNPIFFQSFGPGSPNDFASKLANLGDPTKEQATRTNFFNRLRKPGSAPSLSTTHFPQLNDDVESGDSLTLTPVQFDFIKQWASGNFKADFGAPSPGGELLPDALDRVSLQACVGGAFFPGIEAGHLISDKTLYAEAFRLDATTLKPGQLTAGNAVPWQADFLACQLQGTLGWWPAQRPDTVFTDPAQTGDIGQTSSWTDNIGGVTGATGLIKNFGKLGIVKKETGPGGKTVFIERERKIPH